MIKGNKLFLCVEILGKWLIWEKKILRMYLENHD